MNKQELKDLEQTICSTCNGDGIIRKYDNESAYDREEDKLPSSYLASLRSFNRSFNHNKKCTKCDGGGYLLEPIYK